MEKFNKDKYMTSGVASLPDWIPELVYTMITHASRKVELDYLQVFEFSSTKDPEDVNNWFVLVKHSQEHPQYFIEISIDCEVPVNEKLYCIDDGTHSTLLKAFEY